MSRISREAALKILNENNTPEHVIRHCMAVAKVSVIIGEELNKNGMSLSIDIIEGAAMLHDISRVFENHEEIGGEIIEKEGYLEEASIIKKHMHYEITNKVSKLREIDIVCLSDRMVKEDKYVGLLIRMEYILKKWQGNIKAQEYIKDKVKQQILLVKDIEKFINKNFDDLMY